MIDLFDKMIFKLQLLCVFMSLCKGKSEYVGLISEELETHATVYQLPGEASNVPNFITNHGLLTQEHFLQLLRRAKVRQELISGVEKLNLGLVSLQSPLLFNMTHLERGGKHLFPLLFPS